MLCGIPHNITDEAVQSSAAWCANSRGGNPYYVRIPSLCIKQVAAQQLIVLF